MRWIALVLLVIAASAVPYEVVMGSQAAGTTARAAASNSREEFTRRLVAAAVERTQHSVRYDPAYVRIAYPGGDVPADTGVCTDEVIRSYRAVGVDLQKEVHEDMLRNFGAYPKKWRWLLGHADSNIDHRRVPNLMVFFQRKGESLPITARREDYSPGALVTWDLGGGVPHIGIVVDQKDRSSGRYKIVHNIGQGPKMEDALFTGKLQGTIGITGRPSGLVGESSFLPRNTSFVLTCHYLVVFELL